MSGPEEFRGTERFRILRRLGAGAFGVVYEALDRERAAVVALKTLRQADPASVYRFKHEFRSLADLTHPNLVNLYELLSDGEQWFFTMERVEGTSFLDFVRPEGRLDMDTAPTMPLEATMGRVDAAEPSARSPSALPPLQHDRLRRSLRQLAEGVSALHEAGKLHRDIKSTNVLVTGEGRVVLLDFGLVRGRDPSELNESLNIVGTPAYMSPEQGANLPVTEASDWYSVGVMLYEALTGCLPFPQRSVEVLADKQRHDPPPPSSLLRGVPEDLDALCMGLLRRDPGARPPGREVVRSLGSAAGGAPGPSPAPSPPPGASPFVGREPEMAALADAFQATRDGRAVTVYVHCSSGMGKTALVRRFLDGLRSREDVVVLTGRCHERESVPYKALDGLVDALSQYLKHLPQSQAEAILPRDVLALARLFPVLRQVEAVAGARRRVLQIPDSQELRRRAFGALRELLARLSEGHAVVLFIDDLQWGDMDSAALLGEILRPPDPPPLLLLASYRSEEADTSPLLSTLLPLRGTSGFGSEVRELVLGELEPSQARDLAAALLADAEGASQSSAEAIARESAGSPFLIDELVKYTKAGGGLAEHEGGAGTALGEMIQVRLARLPEEARRLLEVVAVAGQAVDLEVVTRVAGVAGEQQGTLAVLRGGHLVRTRETRTVDEIETYHSRIRETVVAHLSPEALRAHHRSLALALAASGRADPERLAAHFQGGGDSESAAEYAAVAAAKASDALAFDHAARLYRLALDFHPGSASEARVLRVKLGEALARAGRGAEAARSYLAAAEGAPAAETLELQRRAAEQFLLSGHIDEGFATIRNVLANMGMKLAETPRRALLSLLLHRAQIKLRGLGFRERDASEVSPQELIRIDTCWSVAVGLGIVDNIRGADFQARHLLLALRAGEPYRIARALAIEVGYTATAGGRARQRTERLVRAATALAERIDHPHAIALATLTAGLAAFLQGRWSEGRTLSERAEAILRERCTGVAWELDSAQIYSLFCDFTLGELSELSRRLPALLKEARDRGDLYVDTSLRTRFSYLVSLASDRPDEARQDVRQGIERWSREGFHLQHFWALFAQGEIDLYCGEGVPAWNRVTEIWPRLSGSLLLRIQNTRILALHLRARSALAVGAGSLEPEPLLRAALDDARRIERERMPWGEALAALVQAAVAASRGRLREAAEGLVQAETACGRADMALYEAAARRRRGEILGGDEGRSLVAAADAWMAGQGIRNPARMTAMLAPCRWDAP